MEKANYKKKKPLFYIAVSVVERAFKNIYAVREEPLIQPDLIHFSRLSFPETTSIGESTMTHIFDYPHVC